jgi:hypothetical protein
MRPDVSEQLRGIRRILTEAVAPQVDDEYAADVLAGILTTIDLLADAWSEVPGFLRWDIEATRQVLVSGGLSVPAGPDDLFDLSSLEAHHRDVRRALEAAVPMIVDDDRVAAKMVQLFRDRADRYPFAARRQGGSPAHPSR